SHLGSMRALKTLFHTFLAYLLYMLASMASVRGVNVPMYTTLRRTTVAFTMVIEYMLTGVICGPISMVRTYMCGDLGKTINFPHLFSHCFMVVLLCSCVLAFLLNYIIFLNTTLNSALTQTICGNMKYCNFGSLTQMNVIGQLLGFFGSVLYAYYKIIGR
ncbi:hypothetical protein F2Q69_00033025, partial [Brassica cretica]